MWRSLRRVKIPTPVAAHGAVRRSRWKHSLRYTQEYQRSVESPEDFWAEAAKDVQWFRPWDKVLDEYVCCGSQGPIHKWFAGAQLNTSYNALDFHVACGRGKSVAIRYDSPLSNTKRSLTYDELLEQVSTFAGGLRKLGVKKGDRVLIYMPAVVECAVAMLACARLGAIHSVVFGGFASGELAARIDDAQPTPKGVIKYEPLLNEALERASWKPKKNVILQREMCPFDLQKGRDIEWHDLMAQSSPVDAVPVLATDPLYILYTSGTTGMPKGVVRDNGGHAVALKWSMSNIMNTYPGETFWAASDMGWVVGHSYIVYGPLLQGCTVRSHRTLLLLLLLLTIVSRCGQSVIYEGKPVGTPDAGAYWRVLSEYGVKTMFTAPTALRAIRKEDPDGKLIQQNKAAVHETFKAMFVAGERGDPKTLKFFADQLEVPVVDHWWQTETGWPMSSQCLGMKQDTTSGPYPGIKFGSVSRAVPGYNIQLMSAEKSEHDAHHGHNHDSDEPDKELVVKLPLPPGHVPVALLVLKNDNERSHEEITAQVVADVREQIGSFVCLKTVAMVPGLPKTRSGKVMRATISAIAESRPFKVPATIENAGVLADVREALKKVGYAENDVIMQ
ncbi:hypothetical protein BBJ28_00004608 [Nothophytophthora sp. Chile5]|nr:hypothetical protein BBJ28_00004608 [Nothophytophthora sp. Chile5]